MGYYKDLIQDIKTGIDVCADKMGREITFGDRFLCQMGLLKSN